MNSLDCYELMAAILVQQKISASNVVVIIFLTRIIREALFRIFSRLYKRVCEHFPHIMQQ